MIDLFDCQSSKISYVYVDLKIGSKDPKNGSNNFGRKTFRQY